MVNRGFSFNYWVSFELKLHKWVSKHYHELCIKANHTFYVLSLIIINTICIFSILLQKSLSTIIHTLSLSFLPNPLFIITAISNHCYSLLCACLHCNFGPHIFCNILQVFKVGRFPCHHSRLQIPPQILGRTQVWPLEWPFRNVNIVLC